MKNAIIILSAIIFAISHQLITTCPACVGRMGKNSPPFFSDKNNKYYQEKLAATFLRTQQHKKEAPHAKK